MRPQSAKSKGRRLQQKIVADLYEAFPELQEGDLRSTSMGCPGEDIQMSAAARKLIPFSFESKNQERLNVWDAYEQSKSNCGKNHPAVVMKKNHSEMLCVIRWSTFVHMLKSCNNVQNSIPSSESIPDQLRSLATQLESMNETDINESHGNDELESTSDD